MEVFKGQGNDTEVEDRIKAAGEEVKNYSVFQDWMNDMDLKNKITDK